MDSTSILSDAWWLAKRQMRDTWAAYPLTAMYFLIMGLAFSQGDTRSAGIGHMVLMMILIQAVVSTRLMTWQKDNDLVRYQMFLQGLPVPAMVKVLSSVFASLVAGCINAPVYFGIMGLTNDWNVSGSQYLVFAVFWTGIAVALSGIAVIQEVAMDIRQWTTSNMIFLGVFVLIMIVVHFTTNFDAIRSTLEVAASRPALMVVLGVGSAITGLLAAIPLATRAYRTREFPI